MPHHEAQRRSREAQETVPWTVAKTPIVWNFLGTDPAIITAKEVEPGDFALNEGESLWLWTGLNWNDITTREVLVTKTSAYIILASDGIILCDAESASFTVTLPPAADNSGKKYYIKKIDGTLNTVTIDGDESDTIDTGLTAVLTTPFTSVTIASDGSDWWIL